MWVAGAGGGTPLSWKDFGVEEEVRRAKMLLWTLKWTHGTEASMCFDMIDRCHS